MKTILVDAVNTLVVEGVGVDMAMKSLLDKYPNSKIVLTNANEEEAVRFGLTNLPYPIFTLAHQPNKTDSKYYRKMLEHFGLEADETVYFEHNPEAVQSARSVGITSYQFDSVNRDMAALKQFLDQNT